MCLVATLTAVLALTFLYRMVNSITQIPTFNKIVNTVTMLAGAGFVASVAWTFSAKEKDCSLVLITPAAGVFVSSIAFLGGIFMKYYYNDAVKLLFVMLPAICVLYIIKHIYGPGFYAVASYLALACCLLYVFDRFMLMELLSGYGAVYGFVLMAVGAVGVFASSKAMKGKGEIVIFGKKTRIFATGAKYSPAYIACAAVAAVGAVFIPSPSAAVYYGLAAMGGLILLFAIYYTYTLMYQ